MDLTGETAEFHPKPNRDDIGDEALAMQTRQLAPPRHRACQDESAVPFDTLATSLAFFLGEAGKVA